MPLDEYAVPLKAVSDRRPSRPHITTGAPNSTGMRPPHPSSSHRGDHLGANRAADLGYRSPDPKQATLPPGAEPARRPGTAVPYSPPEGHYGQGDSRSHDQGRYQPAISSANGDRARGDDRTAPLPPNVPPGTPSHDLYQRAATQASRHDHSSPGDNDHHGYDPSGRSDAHARALSRLDPASSRQGTINGTARGHDPQPTGARSQAYALHPGPKSALNAIDIENNVAGSSHPSRVTGRAPSSPLPSTLSKATVGRTRSTDQGTLSPNRSTNDGSIQRTVWGSTTTSPTADPRTRSNRTSTSSQSQASPVDGWGTSRSPEHGRAPGLRSRKASAETGPASHLSPRGRRAPQSPPAQASTSALGFQSRQDSLQAEQGVHHSPTSPVGSPIHAHQNTTQATASRFVAPTTSAFEVAEHDDEEVPDLSPTELGSNASNTGSPQDATGTDVGAAGIDVEDAENGTSSRRLVTGKIRKAPSKVMVHREPLVTHTNRSSLGFFGGSFKMPLAQLSAPQEIIGSSSGKEIQSPDHPTGKGKGKSASWAGHSSPVREADSSDDNGRPIDPNNLTREQLLSAYQDLEETLRKERAERLGQPGPESTGPNNGDVPAPAPLSPSNSAPGIVDPDDVEKGYTDPTLRQKPWYWRVWDFLWWLIPQIWTFLWAAAVGLWTSCTAFLRLIWYIVRQKEMYRRAAPHIFVSVVTLTVAVYVTWGTPENDSRLISWGFFDTNLICLLKKVGKVIAELREADKEAKEEQDKEQAPAASSEDGDGTETSVDRKMDDAKKEKKKKETIDDLWAEWFEDFHSTLPTASTCISLRVVGVTLRGI